MEYNSSPAKSPLHGCKWLVCFFFDRLQVISGCLFSVFQRGGGTAKFTRQPIPLPPLCCAATFREPASQRASEPASQRHQASEPASQRASRPASQQATRPPGHQATRPPGHQAIRPPGHQAIRPPGHQATRPPGHQATLCQIEGDGRRGGSRLTRRRNDSYIFRAHTRAVTAIVQVSIYRQ